MGVSCGYPSDVARGRKCMSPKIQARVEALLEGPAKVESAPIPSVDCRALWDRMDAHGYSQNEVARLAGIGDARVPYNLPHGKGGQQVRRSTIVIRVRADRLPEFERIAHNKLRGLWVLVESKPLQLLNTASHRLHAKLHTLGA